MMSQAWQQLDFAESTAPVREQLDSSPAHLPLITNVAFARELPKAHILSYFAPPESDVSAIDPDDTLTTQQTVNFDGSNTDLAAEEPAPKHVIFFKTYPRQSAFTSLQKWEGIVLETMEDAFLVRLVDLTSQGPDEEAEFPFDEVAGEDRPLVRPGAIFYWNIGYHDSYSGQRTRVSIIRFRRLPAWTREEIDAAQQEAERLGTAIGWE